MYNIKGPSKIVAKTARRRLPQNIDNYRDYNKSKSSENGPIELEKPVFHKKSTPSNTSQETISPQHEEIINFIHESWSSVCSELDRDSSDSGGNLASQGQRKVFYYEDNPCEKLQDFRPFDLESWWGKRLYAYITSSANVKN